MLSILKKFRNILEKHSLIISLAFLVGGVLITARWSHIGEAVASGVQSLIGAYGYFVPFLIYFLLTPSLIKLKDLAKKYGNGWLMSVLRQFVVARVLAILFAITMLSLLFGLNFHLNHGSTFAMAMSQAGHQLLKTFFFSTTLYGVYAALVTAVVATKWRKVDAFFQRVGDGIEYLGEFLMILSPAFMFAVGSFLYHLPAYLNENFSSQFSGGEAGLLASLQVNFLGLQYVPKSLTFVALYLLIGLTTGVLCLLWHGLYMLYTKWREPRFSFIYYVKKYWIKVYPLLWSSSSESLAVPLSLSLMKKNFPSIPSGVRQFVIAGGSYLGINGTLISVYVMAVFLARVVGVEISFLQLLISLPVVFVLGYAVPGIPGELVIFAGTMSVLLGITPAAAPLFLALYLTLQIGLPDSFRTGCNSTDSALLAIISAYQLEKLKEEKAVTANAGFCGQVCAAMKMAGQPAVYYKKEKDLDPLAGGVFSRINNKIL